MDNTQEDSTSSTSNILEDILEFLDFTLAKGANIDENASLMTLETRFGFGLDMEYSINKNLLNSECLNGSLDIIRSQHQHNPDILRDDLVSLQAFLIAIKQANIELIDLLIELGANIYLVDPQNQRNLFMIACAFGTIEVVKHLFTIGNFDVNAKDTLGNCALLYSHNAEIVKFLIEKGADPFARTPNGNITILHIACEVDSYELVEYLLTETSFKECDLSTLAPAEKGLIEIAIEAIFNPFKIIDYLLQKGVDINERNLKNETAFSNTNRFSISRAEFLLSRGADVNSVDTCGLNALQQLLDNEVLYHLDEKEMALFVDHGIDLNHQDNKGWTIMHYACKELFYASTIEYLLDSGARTDIPNKEGDYPFDFAYQLNPFGDIVEIFEKRGLNYSKDIDGEVRSHNCDHCNSKSASINARCGHYLHIKCLKKKKTCPLCDSRVTLSNSVEKIIRERNFDNLTLLTDHELFLLLDNYFENEGIIDFDVVLIDVKRRKESNDKFKLPEHDQYPSNLYPKACAYGRLELVKFFDSINLDRMDPYTETCAFVFSLISGNMPMIEYLLDKFGVKFVNKPYSWIYPVQLACMLGNSEIFEFLAGKGANLNSFEIVLNLLDSACDGGSLDILKSLIEKHGFDKQITDKVIQRLINGTISDSMFNARLRNNLEFEIVVELISTYEKTDDKVIEISTYLLERGVDLNAENASGNTPVSLTGLYDREKVFDFFVSYSENVLNSPFKMDKHQTLLINVAKCGKNMNFFEKVIKMGADVNWTNVTGRTALMEACSSGNYEMCSRLIELGASINAVDNEQYTALHYLCRSGNDKVDILELLLANGADTEKSTKDGSNALHLAARSVSVNIVKKLLEIGINPNPLNMNLETPLHSVFHYENIKKNIFGVVKALVEAGADINAKDVDGESPVDLVYNSFTFRKVSEYFKTIQ